MGRQRICWLLCVCVRAMELGKMRSTDRWLSGGVENVSTSLYPPQREQSPFPVPVTHLLGLPFLPSLSLFVSLEPGMLWN